MRLSRRQHRRLDGRVLPGKSADDLQEKIAIYRAGMAVDLPIATESYYYENFDVEFRNSWNNSNYYCIFATDLTRLHEK